MRTVVILDREASVGLARLRGQVHDRGDHARRDEISPVHRRQIGQIAQRAGTVMFDNQ